MDEILTRAHQLQQEHTPFALATVVRVSRPASARPGAKALVFADGSIEGWVGGSCAQPAVAREGRAALADGQPRLLCLVGVDGAMPERGEGVVVQAMTCHSGGTIEVYIEPFTPRPQLLLFGESGVTQALVQIGSALSFDVVVVDPNATAERFPLASQVHTEFEQVGVLFTPQSYVVIATHGSYDEVVLEQALASQAAYVALVASRRRAKAIIEGLRQGGVAAEQLDRLRAPAGLDIGASQPAEIALSIMAEIVQVRRKNALTLAQAKPDAEPAAPPVAQPPAQPAATITLQPKQPTITLMAAAPPQIGNSATAVDPVCNMLVEIATARWQHEHEGQVYYFCCPGCRRSFQREPEKYLAGTTR